LFLPLLRVYVPFALPPFVAFMPCGHLQIIFFFSSWSGETKKMNSFLWNGAIFQLKWLFSVCLPEALQFINCALIHGKSLFFFNFAPGSISIEPLYFGAINKTVLFFPI
jgi:hypothetical protein